MKNIILILISFQLSTSIAQEEQNPNWEKGLQKYSNSDTKNQGTTIQTKVYTDTTAKKPVEQNYYRNTNNRIPYYRRNFIIYPYNTNIYNGWNNLIFY